MNFLKLAIPISGILFLAGCGGGGATSAAPASATVNPAPAAAPTPSAGSVEISGKVTYDRVPHTLSSGLDYANTIEMPVRGAVVEAVSSSGTVLASTLSDDSGAYAFTVDMDTDLRVQIKSQLVSNDAAKWNFSVTDNTQGNQLYALQGSIASSGSNTGQTRNLHASHGWTGQAYETPRAAGPFAILDSVYLAAQTFADLDPNINFPALEIRWSTENKTIVGNKAIGQIGTSAYFPDIDGGTIYLLGQEDRDTDEYDPHVILHEWGHYFEHQLSRTDSIGGLHSLNDRLDPRVAFSEAWGNALSAMLTGDSTYRDSSGAGQASGFSFDLETGVTSNPGWFSEASIGAILYDIFDDRSDSADRLSGGLGPIYDVMRSDAYLDAPVFATIFAFADGVRSQFPDKAAGLDVLLDAQSISGEGPDGNGEVNSGAIRTALPVYKEVRLNGAAAQICSVDDAGLHNKLGNREFVFLNLDADRRVTLSAVKSSGDENRDPDFNIWQGNQLIHESASSAQGQEVVELDLSAGDYVIEAYDFFNINGASAKRGDGCYSLTVTG